MGEECSTIPTYWVEPVIGRKALRDIFLACNIAIAVPIGDDIWRLVVACVCVCVCEREREREKKEFRKEFAGG